LSDVARWENEGGALGKRGSRELNSLSKMKVQLLKLAHARSGDKGDTANVGLIALRDEFYPLLVREVTAERVKRHFAGLCKGEVERFELQGKTFSTALLRMEIDVDDADARSLGLTT
jgi:hypothetical protein